jgi:hypothetical protein
MRDPYKQLDEQINMGKEAPLTQSPLAFCAPLPALPCESRQRTPNLWRLRLSASLPVALA